ncbi:MAG TPA: lysylphosphatidylglycerol synthase transmembrane domain-containing protein [Anaerolineales bacterium]|nr:lysylphosphatidylglycerol synthase transmembrane domain-containing protein [Anaerolineales bacterium]
MKASKSSVWGSARRWLPGLFLSLIALGLLLRLTDWREVAQAFTVMDLRWLPVALVSYLVSMWLRAFAWRTLLRQKASPGRVFLALNQGYLLNNILPFRLGEVGRAFLLGKAARLSPLYVLPTILIERIYDLAIAAGLLLGTLPLVIGVEAARPAALIVLSLVALSLLVLFLAARHQQHLGTWLERVAGRWEPIRRAVLPRLSTLLEGLSALTTPADFFFSVTFLFGSWLFGAVEIHVLLNSGAFSAPFWWTGFVLGVLSLGIALPSAPAALGVYEAAFVGALSILGVPVGEGLAYAIVVHLIHISVTGLIGAYGLLRDGETISGFLNQVQGTQSEI